LEGEPARGTEGMASVLACALMMRISHK
jgi:hypothetical protein